MLVEGVLIAMVAMLMLVLVVVVILVVMAVMLVVVVREVVVVVVLTKECMNESRNKPVLRSLHNTTHRTTPHRLSPSHKKQKGYDKK